MPIPTIQNALDRKSTKNIAYDTLREWIIDGTLKPGEKIIDTEISTYFSISRTPVREALQMLAEQNLVKITPSKGTHVTEINQEDMCNVYDALCLLHTSILALVFQQITPEIIEELKAINVEMSKMQKEENFVEMHKLDSAFHDVFFNLAKNPYLKEFSEQLQIHARRAENINFSVYTSAAKSTEEHEKIIAALENDDLALAQQCMTENWLRFVNKDLANFVLKKNKKIIS